MFGIKLTFEKNSKSAELLSDMKSLSSIMAHESKRVYHRHNVRKLQNSIAKLEELEAKQR